MTSRICSMNFQKKMISVEGAIDMRQITVKENKKHDVAADE